MFVIMKVIASAFVIAIVTEISRRFPAYGGIVAALPLVSLLSIIWLYMQGEQTATLSKFALGVLWGFPATAVLLIIVYVALQNSIHLFLSIALGGCGWLLFLVLQNVVLDYARGIFS
ncbi:hypothetical protein A1A1_11962 [Planococcus antarcticus DSM 14505]|uniref:DUF3147 family protein n=1 Tax=Planococcus antarcticus DSM 14505 TaxID=1185653 RepID=A0A1C7DDD2_9BACL|nr:DUF3147 family protein [Planococcus antarcticus]ANU09496.1 hypothetical protein BBH88_03825 [Planococcus antarcticus DSM 14505]EIM06277.1 hypothetical protein A1A1_11962 [Planococcus antarcticus DSM 14505]